MAAWWKPTARVFPPRAPGGHPEAVGQFAPEQVSRLASSRPKSPMRPSGWLRGRLDAGGV